MSAAFSNAESSARRLLTRLRPEDPSESLAPQYRICEPKLVLLVIVFDEPEQDTSSLKDRMTNRSRSSLVTGQCGSPSSLCDILIDQYWNPSVRIRSQESGSLLIFFIEADKRKVVRQLFGRQFRICEDELFQHYRHFVPVRSGRCPQM